MSSHTPPFQIVAFGGGHGLFATLRALRVLSREHPADITAVVTVADDGGSSGKLRRELGCLPPGDLRQALVALSDDPDSPEVQVMQRRFATDGPLNGHPVGNLLLANAFDVYGDSVAALHYAANVFGSRGRVLPMALEPLVIEADVSGAHSSGESIVVRGQAEVAATRGTVRRVRVLPENPRIAPELHDAVSRASLLIFGPGSWFTSVIPHFLIPGIRDAILASAAHKLVLLNLSTDAETSGWALEEHLRALREHAPWFTADTVVADTQLAADKGALTDAAKILGAEMRCESVTSASQRPYHDVQKLATVLHKVVEPINCSSPENPLCNPEW